MIDLNDVRTRPEAYQEAATKKHLTVDIAAFVELDQRYRQVLTDLELLRAEQNKVSKIIPTLKGDDKQTKLEEMKSLAARLKEQTAELRELEERWNREQLLIPSIPLDVVPVGADDTANQEVRRWGEIGDRDYEIRDHVELGQLLDIIDVERGVKIAGARSYFLKGDGVRLQHAIMSLAMDYLHSKGFTLFDCPHIVKYDAMMGTGYFPGGEDMAYHLDERDDDCYLIGTSEVSVASYHSNEILEEGDLPKRYAGYSPCYRREAGTYGKDTRGLYRVHQFFKVEQVVVCRADAEESARMHAELLANAETVLRLLELPYRVVISSTGDMGQGQVFKNDIEAWMPSRNAFGETHSCSTFYDFQARRLKLRYRTADGSKVFCHTLNNTCVASPRILIPLLEYHQNSDGSVTIPVALRPYLGGQERIEPKGQGSVS